MRTHSDEALLEEIRRVADVADSDGAPTLTQLDEYSDIADTTFMRRFGSWNDAVAEAGFEPNAPETEVLTAELIRELRQLRKELGSIPTADQVSEHSTYSHSAYVVRFGSWSEALEAAFNSTTEAGDGVSKQELVAELRRIAADHGTPPHFEDVRKYSDYQARTYTKRFESWDAALQAADITPPTRRVSTDDLVDELYRLRDELDKRPTSRDVVREGKHGLATYQRRFGSWSEAVTVAFGSHDT